VGGEEEGGREEGEEEEEERKEGLRKVMGAPFSWREGRAGRRRRCRGRKGRVRGREERRAWQTCCSRSSLAEGAREEGKEK